LLLQAAIQAGVQRYVQQSITMLYGDRGTELADETTPLALTARLRSAGEMEALVQAAPLAWCILRGAYFYGPGTSWEDARREAARKEASSCQGMAVRSSR
jgi:uncharacterized protein YbjT (DUF2867 family)